jgi:hypothetical protein
MKLRPTVLWLALLAIGILAGATGSPYWEQQARKVESALALDQANSAAKRGDIDNAIVFAAQSYALYPDSPLAGFMLKELTEKRAAMTGSSK